MVVENITTTVLPESLINQLSTLTTIFQAVGGLIIAYILFNIIRIIWLKRRKEELTEIKELLKNIDKKLDRF